MTIDQYTDQEIVAAILNRNAFITKEYLYKKCYPLFKSRYDKYYTGCENCVEFINEIYVYIMTPGPKTGKCYLSTFGFRCSLTGWLRIVVGNYCRQLFKKKLVFSENGDEYTDRNDIAPISLDMKTVNNSDIKTVLNMMSNQRYAKLIYYRYVEGHDNEETAELMGMSMDNYYNKHKLAKEQFASILKKEGLI